MRSTATIVLVLALHGCATSGPARGEPPMIQLSELEPNRIAGEKGLHLSEPEKSAIARAGGPAVVIVKLCLDETGAPSRVKMERTTGHGDFAMKAIALISDWRFRPYLVEGRPVPVCTIVIYHYNVPADHERK